MKNVLLVDASPRKGGNSEIIVDLIASDLKDCNLTVFKMKDKKCNPCLACGACQGKDTQNCVQKDDITQLLPIIENCDAIIIATPIYNQQICSQAKLFMERWYPFFDFSKPLMSNTSKPGKKAALVCSFWGSPVDITQKYANWTAKNFNQMGADKTKAILFPGIPEKGDILNRAEYIAQIHDLSSWLID